MDFLKPTCRLHWLPLRTLAYYQKGAIQISTSNSISQSSWWRPSLSFPWNLLLHSMDIFQLPPTDRCWIWVPMARTHETLSRLLHLLQHLAASSTWLLELDSYLMVQNANWIRFFVTHLFLKIQTSGLHTNSAGHSPSWIWISSLFSCSDFENRQLTLQSTQTNL